MAGKTFTDRLETWLILEGLPQYVSGMGQAGAATRGLAYQQMMLYMAQQRYARQMMIGGAVMLGAGVMALKAASDFEQYKAMIFAVTRDQGAANRVFEDAIDIGMRMPGTTKEVIRAGAELTNYAKITGLTTLAQKDFMQGTVDLATVFRGAEMEIDPHRMSMAIISFLGGRIEMLRRLGMSLSVLQQFGYEPGMGPAERLNVILKVMENYSGAAALQMQTLAGQMSNLWDIVQRVSASLMEPLLPAFAAAAKAAQALGLAINYLPGPTKGAIGALSLLTGVLVLGTGAFLAARAALAILMIEYYMWQGVSVATAATQGTLTGATAAATGAVGAQTAAIGAATGALAGYTAQVTAAAGANVALAGTAGAAGGAATGAAGGGFWATIGKVTGLAALWKLLQTPLTFGKIAVALGAAWQVIVKIVSAFGIWGKIAAAILLAATAALKWRENLDKVRQEYIRIQYAASQAFGGLHAKVGLAIAQGRPEDALALARQARETKIAEIAALYEKALKRNPPILHAGEVVERERLKKNLAHIMDELSIAGKASYYKSEREKLGEYVEQWRAMREYGQEAKSQTIFDEATRGLTAALEAQYEVMVGLGNVTEQWRIKTDLARLSQERLTKSAGGWSEWARKIIGGGEEFASAIHPLDVFKATGVLSWDRPKKAVVELVMPPGWAAKIKEDTVGITVRQVTQAVGAM